MEGAMLKANLWKSVPKVELDQRARDGRLQLEQINGYWSYRGCGDAFAASAAAVSSQRSPLRWGAFSRDDRRFPWQFSVPGAGGGHPIWLIAELLAEPPSLAAQNAPHRKGER